MGKRYSDVEGSSALSKKSKSSSSKKPNSKEKNEDSSYREEGSNKSGSSSSTSRISNGISSKRTIEDEELMEINIIKGDQQGLSSVMKRIKTEFSEGVTQEKKPKEKDIMKMVDDRVSFHIQELKAWFTNNSKSNEDAFGKTSSVKTSSGDDSQKFSPALNKFLREWIWDHVLPKNAFEHNDNFIDRAIEYLDGLLQKNGKNNERVKSSILQELKELNIGASDFYPTKTFTDQILRLRTNERSNWMHHIRKAFQVSSDFKIAVFPKDDVKIAEWVSDVEDLHEKMKFPRKNGLGQEWKNVIELALDKSNKGRDSIKFFSLEALAMISISQFLMAKKKLGADEAVKGNFGKE